MTGIFFLLLTFQASTRIEVVPQADWWFKGYVLATAAMAVLNLGTLFVIWRQRQVMREQLAEMRAGREQTSAEMQTAGKQTDSLIAHANKQAEAAERSAQAIMNAERARIVCKFKRIVSGRELFGLSISNCGRTPALLIDVKFQTRMPMTLNTVQLPESPYYGPETEFEHARVLCAGEAWDAHDWTTRVSPSELTEEAFREIKSSERRYYIYGRVEYRDVFRDQRYETRFCYMYSPMLDDFIVFGPRDYTMYT
jgi:hypothetical protein